MRRALEHLGDWLMDVGEAVGERLTLLSHNRAAWLVSIGLAVAGSAVYVLTLTDLAWWLCPIAVVPVLVLMYARLAEDDLGQQLPPQDPGGGGFSAP